MIYPHEWDAIQVGSTLVYNGGTHEFEGTVETKTTNALSVVWSDGWRATFSKAQLAAHDRVWLPIDHAPLTTTLA